MGTEASALSATAKHNILLGILEKGTTKNATAIKAGIAPTTFDRKLNNTGSFTLAELGSIAEALEVKLADLIKDAA